MKYYVKWNDLGEMNQETFSNILDARKWAKIWSKGKWFEETWIVDADATVIDHYIYGFAAE